MNSFAKHSFFFLVLWLCTFFTPALFAKAKPKSLGDQILEKAELMLSSPPVDKEICFSPEEKCDLRLVKFIQSAKTSLDIAIFDLTHVQIAHEIMVASKRIPVRVVVDRRQSKGVHSLVSLLVKAGVSVKIGAQRGIMHNKFVVLDGKWIETGSFNYTTNASNNNNENQIYLSDAGIVARYRERFELLWRNAREFGVQVTRRGTGTDGEKDRIE